MTLGQSLFQRCLQMFCFLPCSAMADCIIGIAFERNARKRPTHPCIDAVMQKKIRQQRAYHSTLRCSGFPFLDSPIGHLYRSLQPSFDVEQNPGLQTVLPKRSYQKGMIDRIEKAFDVEVQSPVIVPASLARLLDRLMR